VVRADSQRLCLFQVDAPRRIGVEIKPRWSFTPFRSPSRSCRHGTKWSRLLGVTMLREAQGPYVHASPASKPENLLQMPASQTQPPHHAALLLELANRW